WNTLISRPASRPAIAIISISESQPAIHSAARVLDCVRFIREAAGLGQAGIGERAVICNAQMRRGSDALRCNFAVGARLGSVLRRRSQGGLTHAYLATGRMVETPRLFARRRGRRS